MLVSSIARMNAMMHRQMAEYGMMQNYDAINSAMQGIYSGAFSGANSRQLAAMDARLQMSLIQNQDNYLYYSMLEKKYAQQLAKERQEEKERLNIFA